MLKGITKAVAYYKAPIKTFAVLHPWTAIRWTGIFLVVAAVLSFSTRPRQETRAA